MQSSSFPNIKKSISRMFDELHALRNGWPKAKERADLDRQDGWPLRTGNFEGHITGKSDPTAALALGPSDDVAASEKRLAYNVSHAHQHLIKANIEVRYLQGMGQKEGQRLKKSLDDTLSVCIICEAIVPGTPNDRLRRSRCNSCFAYFNRNGKDKDIQKQVAR